MQTKTERTFRREIDLRQVELYVANGWVVSNDLSDTGSLNRVLVERTMEWGGASKIMLDHFQRGPISNICRGSIRRPLHEFNGGTLVNAVQFMNFLEGPVISHMSQSMKRMYSVLFDYRVDRVEDLVLEVGGRHYVLHMYHNMTSMERLAYTAQLAAMRLGRDAKAPNVDFNDLVDDCPNFTQDGQRVLPKIDFWYDLGNDVIWSYDKQFMSRVPKLIRSTCEQVYLR